MRRTTQKTKLSRVLLEDLARTGSPVDLSVAEEATAPKPVEIEQVGGVYESQLFELEDGRLGFMADLAITNRTRSTIQVVEIQLRTPLIDNSFEWLMPLELKLVKVHCRKDSEFTHRVYRFPGSCGLEFPYQDVINHLILGKGLLQSKRRVGGWLLGIGGLMGAGLLHGHWSDLSLTIISSDHHEYTETLHLWIERLERRSKPIKRNSNLYEPVSPAIGSLPAHVDQSEQLDRLQRSRKGEFVPPRCEGGLALISSLQKEAQKDRVVRNLRNS